MKKWTACLLMAALFVFLCACTPGMPAAVSELDANTVIDASGIVHTISAGDDLTIASVYAVSIPFIVALDLSDQVVAANYKSKFWPDNVPALSKAGTVGRGKVDLEALAALEPSVLIHRANDPETVEAVGKIGVEVICIAAEDMRGVRDTLDLLGTYFGKKDRSKEAKDWIQSKFDKIDAIVQKIPQSERKTALVMGGELGKIAGGDMLQAWMVEKAGGIYCAGDVKNNSNWINIGVESVFQWDPEFLFCTSSTPLEYTVEGLYEDPVWKDLRALQNHKLALIPAKIDSWDLPSIACVIGTMWMLRQMHPDYFSAQELAAEIDEYYTFMFGRTFGNDYLGYDPAHPAGKTQE